MQTDSIISRSPEETYGLAGRLVASHPGAMVLALHGDLGSGKTCFVQGIAAALGIDRPVTSPTFTLINEYVDGSRPLYHIDLYRLSHPEDVSGLGFAEYLETNGITAIEWAERAAGLLPESALHIRFEVLGGRNTRRIVITHRGPGPPW